MRWRWAGSGGPCSPGWLVSDDREDCSLVPATCEGAGVASGLRLTLGQVGVVVAVEGLEVDGRVREGVPGICASPLTRIGRPDDDLSV